MKFAACSYRLDFRNEVSQPLGGGRITNHWPSKVMTNARRLAPSESLGKQLSVTNLRAINAGHFQQTRHLRVKSPCELIDLVVRDFDIIARIATRRSMAKTDHTTTHVEPPMIPHSEPVGGTGSLEAAMMRERNPVRRFFKLLGPGLITGASDDDPSGIGTYAVAGAAFGFSTLWTALFTLPLMTAVLLTCARKIGRAHV